MALYQPLHAKFTNTTTVHLPWFNLMNLSKKFKRQRTVIKSRNGRISAFFSNSPINPRSPAILLVSLCA